MQISLKAARVNAGFTQEAVAKHLRKISKQSSTGKTAKPLLMLAILQPYANFIRWIRIVFFCPINQLKVYHLTIPQPSRSIEVA